MRKTQFLLLSLPSWDLGVCPWIPVSAARSYNDIAACPDPNSSLLLGFPYWPGPRPGLTPALCPLLCPVSPLLCLFCWARVGFSGALGCFCLLSTRWWMLSFSRGTDSWCLIWVESWKCREEGVRPLWWAMEGFSSHHMHNVEGHVATVKEDRIAGGSHFVGKMGGPLAGWPDTFQLP